MEYQQSSGKPHGMLSLSIGETQLSSWEAARLAPGDIVLTAREAGYPSILLFNNLPIGIGEVAIIEGNFAVHVVDSEFRPAFRLDPGRVDELVELMPAYISLGGFDLDLDCLSGVGRNSIINLGIPAGPGADATLQFGGIPLARGKVVVVGELMGIRITQRLLELPVPQMVRQSGNVADPDQAARAKDYNFAMPDRWSWEQIRHLGEIHSLFQRTVEHSLPGLARDLEGHCEAMLVDQCTLGEAHALLGKFGMQTAWLHDHGSARPGRGNRATPRTKVLEAVDCPRPLSQACREKLEGFISNQGHSSRQPVFLYPGPTLVTADTETRRVIAACLRNGWKKFLDFSLSESPDDPEDLAISEHEMVILVLLRRDPDSQPVLGLVYPYLTLEPYMQILGA